MSLVMKARDYHVFFPQSFILCKTVRVSRLAILRNNKNDPCGYPNKSLFISVTDWTTQGPFLCLAGLWPHESKFWNILMKTLTNEVSEQPFDSVLRRILWFVSSAAAGLSVPVEPLGFWRGGREMRKCSFSRCSHWYAYQGPAAAESSWAIRCVYVCVRLKSDMPGEWDGTYLISP